MNERFQIAGTLEQYDHALTGWLSYPGEPNPSFHNRMLPAYGLYVPARYAVTIEITEGEPEYEYEVGTRTAELSVRAYSPGGDAMKIDCLPVGADSGTTTFNIGGVQVEEPPGEGAGALGDLGFKGLAPQRRDDPRWEGTAHITFEYERGRTLAETTFSSSDIHDRQERMAYRDGDIEIEIDPDDLPIPEPEPLDADTTRPFPDLGLELDYDGRITGQHTDLTFSGGLGPTFQVGDMLVGVVEPDRDGVEDPEVTISEEATVVGVTGDCELAWRLDDIGCDHLWIRNGSAWVDAGDWHEINPESGSVEQSVEACFGRFS